MFVSVSDASQRPDFRSPLAKSVERPKIGHATGAQVEPDQHHYVSNYPGRKHRQSYKHRRTPFCGSVGGIGYQDLLGAFASAAAMIEHAAKLRAGAIA